MNADPIIEKIKKLLRMKRGGTPGEIENALAMAAKLARQHGIDLNSINPDEASPQTITHETDIMNLRIPLEARLAANVLVNFFNVKICVHEGICSPRYVPVKAKITFVGTTWDIHVARYVFVFLQRHFRYAWNHRKNKRLRNRSAFLHGMYWGLSTKLQDQQPEVETEQALVLADRKKDYLARLFPDSKPQHLDHDSEADASKYAGIIAGRETEIRSGLDKAAPARPALPPPVGQIALL